MYNYIVRSVFMLFVIHTCSFNCFASESDALGYIDTDEKVVVSCSLSIKIKPVKPLNDENTAKAIVEVTLLSRDGAPIQGTEIDISATQGTFMCNTITNDSGSIKFDANDRTCFFTNSDGKSITNLLNLPLNTQVRIKAKCTCGDYTMTASGSTTISKKIIRKKKSK
jgi:hypothetical protein